ncbi:TIM-barrel domain-containing protein [Rhabdaerophilum sp. SD176]|uniref:glycoside hydrolase family 31 protein n=1 Tax=Rhabdaerophilum sp. SD176 TaxID=2983548 RepID=UPI0024DF6C75|nr:TIM-barrel domain-containing protein [Rhabdaerophilum sp. SD176]
MKALVDATYLGREGAWFRFGLDHGFEARLAVLDHGLARVMFRRPGGYRLDRGWAIAPDRCEPGFEGRPREDLSGFALPETMAVAGNRQVEIAGAGLSVTVRLSPFGFIWRRAGETAPFLEDRGTQAYLVSRRNGAFAHFLARKGSDRHFGLGDKTGRLDKTGRRFRIDAVDPCGYDAETSDPLYKMIPFYIVDGEAGAHGLFYDNLATASVDLGATLDNYHGLFRSYAADDGDLDYYVFAGPRVADVTRRFSWLTGGQAFPPLWSLGFGMTSMAIADAPDADARITAFLAKCHEHGIPCRSFHFGSGYSMHDGKRYAFRWNNEKFPDPAGTIARIEAAGMRAITNLKPCLLEDHPRVGELEKAGLVRDSATGAPATAQFWDGLGFHLDFTSPEGRAWWRDGMDRTLLAHGVTTIWNDNNEYEIWDEDALCAGDGRPFPQALARPAQALLMTKLADEAQRARAPGERPYNITRGGSAGIWRYGQTWSGDNATAWKTLRFNLSQGLTMVLSGMYNTGHDVGGFHGPRPGPELLVRFAEFCCLWPRFVMNSWNDDGITTVPWLYPEVLPEIRAAMALRERLLPLIYTLMWQAATTDEPAIRPLLWHWPDDPAAIDADDVFMLGPDVLVAPVLEEGAAGRRVYFPAHPGGWIDFHDGTVYPGGAMHKVPGPMGRLPLFVRHGAVLPLAGADGRPEARAFGPPAQPFCMVYQDDGVAADWRQRPLVRLDLPA